MLLQKHLMGCLIISLTLGIGVNQAQPPIAWDASFGGAGAEACQKIVKTTDGGYLLVGYSNSEPSGNKTAPNYGLIDYWIVKTDSLGNKQWDQSYGGLGHDIAKNALPSPDGGYLLVGTSRSRPSGNKTALGYGDNHFWIVKIDSLGNKQWEKTYGGFSDDHAHTALPSPDGGYLLVGTSNSRPSGNKTAPNYGGSDYWIVKIDSLGNKQWDQSYGGLRGDFPNNALLSPDGGYLLVGSSNSESSGNKTAPNYGRDDAWIVKVDSWGNKQWDKAYGGTRTDIAYHTLLSPDGGYLLGGWSDSTPSGNKTAPNYGGGDFWIVKVDSWGNKLWDKAYGGTSNESVLSALPGSDGGYLLGGFSDSPPGGNKNAPNYGRTDSWIVKIDSLGNVQWDQSYGGDKGDVPNSVKSSSDDGYLLGGFSDSGPSGNKTAPYYGGSDFWLVKLEGKAQEIQVVWPYEDDRLNDPILQDDRFLVCEVRVRKADGSTLNKGFTNARGTIKLYGVAPGDYIEVTGVEVLMPAKGGATFSQFSTSPLEIELSPKFKTIQP
ncbi:MAG: hypothetical protein AAGI07_03630 [Bacteroidota bacterium]